jgi:hypothetical protein
MVIACSRPQGDSWMILFVVGIMYTEWVSSTKTATLVQDLKGRISSKFAYQFIYFLMKLKSGFLLEFISAICHFELLLF